ncbi:MAG: ThuA domain-containing protein [Dehalococcoidia bacterium]|nr:ThuA domain-containing protein [Dehalococcoidia bacterium]
MNLLLITGGKHPYEESTPVLQAFLEEAGHSITLSESAYELAGDLTQFDAIVLNTLRQEASNNDLNEAQRSGFEGYVTGGGSLLSVHISAASCPDWSETKKITGGGWVLGESWHPPFGWFQVYVDQPDHPIVAGVSNFWTYDECYCGLDIQPGVDVFIHGVVEGEDKPLGWTHQFGDGKVANIALGHAGSSQQHPEFQKLILNALKYLS